MHNLLCSVNVHTFGELAYNTEIYYKLLNALWQIAL